MKNMKKKVLAIALVICLALIAIGGASLAYLTDKDEAVNVMTLGNVEIQQNERDRFGSNFVQNQNLFPMVDLRTDKTAESIIPVEGAEPLFDSGIKNVIDKFVTVTNTGDYSAYVRTILAFETATLGNDTDLHRTYITANGIFTYLDQHITIDGVDYTIAVCVYEAPLAPGATTRASLRQFYLNSNATNEIVNIFGDTYTVLALSQAVQVAGFETVGAAVALDTAFGAITEATAQTWFAQHATTNP